MVDAFAPEVLPVLQVPQRTLLGTSFEVQPAVVFAVPTG